MDCCFSFSRYVQYSVGCFLSKQYWSYVAIQLDIIGLLRYVIFKGIYSAWAFGVAVVLGVVLCSCTKAKTTMIVGIGPVALAIDSIGLMLWINAKEAVGLPIFCIPLAVFYHIVFGVYCFIRWGY